MPLSLNSEIYGKKILVVGLGISGLWTARSLAGHGANITVSEINSESDIDPNLYKEIRKLGVTLETGGHTKENFLNADLIIISPGVSHDMEFLCSAREKGIRVIGELELASSMIDEPIIAVTGTNGKSTVTEALGSILKNAGHKVFVGGNIGTPLTAYTAGGGEVDFVVVEISSFQLDTIETFCPFISIILNISPDHLDRYPDYEAYVQSKLRIFKNQGAGQYIILNDDDERLSSVNPFSGVSVLRYGLEKKKGRHAYIEEKDIVVRLENKKTSNIRFDTFRLPGRHNLENLLAIVLCARVIDISPSVIQKSIDEFKSLPNRLEYVRKLDGIAFYNDSKATNVDAAVRALSSFDRPVVLIAGGRHKGADYAPLVKAAKKNVKKAIFLGEAKQLLSESFGGTLPFSLAEDMNEAVSLAFAYAQKGDAVLLSPACSSFDMFSDYKHRGNAFRTAVKRLARG